MNRLLVNINQKKCGCLTGCKSNSCHCVKFGIGCNLSCRCYDLLNCHNILSDINKSYFFGTASTPNQCFATYLVAHTPNVETIDRDALRNKIMNSDRYSETLADNAIDQWTNKWKTISKGTSEDRMRLTQEYFRLLLSTEDGNSKYFYSFCDDKLYRKDCFWHCITCKKCSQWRVWHCGRCKKCRFGISTPCEECGDVCMVNNCK